MSDAGYTIGQAAGAAGVGVETIRFYERKGYIDRPPKRSRGARRYPQETVDRVRALRQGQALGFSLTETDALLALRADPAADCGDVRRRAEAQLDAVERKRARLGEVADKLRELIAACPGRGATHACAILDAFTQVDESPPDTRAAASGRSLTLRVDGMACGGCAATVRSLLRDAPGVLDATADYVAGAAHVRLDPAATTGSELARRLSDAGFPAAPR